MASIYIRDVSEEDVRAFKSAAAAAGKTLREWAIERLGGNGVEKEVQHDSPSGDEAVTGAHRADETSEESEPNWVPIPGKRGLKMCRAHKDQFCAMCEVD